MIFKTALALAAASGPNYACDIELIVLGVAQDAGIPQIGNPDDPAWDTGIRGAATSLGLVDRRNGRRYLFEATPDIRKQVQRLDIMSEREPRETLGLDGIFLTHAHIGHYAGLMFLGRESAGTQGVPVYVMPRMGKFLSKNGPWEQLVNLGNIDLQPLADDVAVELEGGISVTPLLVPHRDEYSETVGYRVETPGKSFLFIPDIDGWDEWEHDLAEEVAKVTYSFLDATFNDDTELPGRDMSEIPHPRVPDTMERLAGLGARQRAGVHFIHINHTNRLRSDQGEVYEAGFSVASEGQTFCIA
ncbi:MBL fold metallo-hydrolase [Sphingomicrobium sediminis]|uniref:MBL fold metallo-hydrolase n=1 Tax=Sphingomicrobium sediminis TaxID=2950949 RepID=A0A9X2EJM0_9SPHN|nr:MBL fold metallo-hydrolase [Sphingomicrobium sediminis]MCM8556487.1 MBL fold metallo-hydrolase [Sphingomicrobium sediminis]